MKFRLAATCLLLFLMNCGAGTSTGETNVYIVRHGEKRPHNQAFESLINIGVMRAWALVPYLQSSSLPIYSQIDSIYSLPIVGDYHGERPQETCQPLSHSKNISLDLSFTIEESQALGRYLAEQNNPGSTVFICWEHDNIVDIVLGLGVPADEIPHWKSGDFNSVYHITLNRDGSVKSFVYFTQNLPGTFTISSAAFSTATFNPNAISQLSSAERTQLNSSCVGASSGLNSSCTANWNLITCCDTLLYQDSAEETSSCSTAQCNSLYGVTSE